MPSLGKLQPTFPYLITHIQGARMLAGVGVCMLSLFSLGETSALRALKSQVTVCPLCIVVR